MPNNAPPWMALKALVLLSAMAQAAAGQAQSPPGLVPETPVEEVVEALRASNNFAELLKRQVFLGPGGEPDAALELERQRLLETLRSRGYLQAELTLDLSTDRTGEASDLVKIDVHPGAQFRTGAVILRGEAISDPLLARELDDVGLAAIGEVADIDTAQTLADRLQWKLGEHGYPFARVSAFDYLPSRDETADLTLDLELGPAARYQGADLSSVDAQALDLVMGYIPFRIGDRFSVDRLAELRTTLGELAGTGSARVEVVPAGSDGFSLAVRFRRSYQVPRQPGEMLVGVLILAATLVVLATRLLATRGGVARRSVALPGMLIGGLLALSGALVVARAMSFL